MQQISKRIFYNGSRRDREAKRHKWAEWKRDEFKTAASKAHKFAKLPEEWKPPSAKDLRKQMATEVVEIHKAEKENLAMWWRATDKKPEDRGAVGKLQAPLVDLEARDLKNAGKNLQEKHRDSPRRSRNAGNTAV